MTAPADRKEIGTAPYPLGMWAIFRHEPARGHAAKFVMVHDDLRVANSEAERLAGQHIEASGQGDFAFFVVQIVGRVGIISGKLTAELK